MSEFPKNNFFKIFLFLIFVTALCGQQRYNFEHISIPEGLSNTQVWDVIQDKYGFLWIATNDGLNRYDGYTFKIFKNDPGDKTSLPNNSAYSLRIDNDGKLWVGTSTGFCKYNSANETFKTFLPDSNRIGSSSNQILNIIQDNKNRMWILTSDGIFTFNEKTNEIQKTYMKDGKNKVAITGITASLLETSSGEIYSDHNFLGLIKYNEGTNLFERVDVDPKNPGILKEQIVMALYEDKTGKIWISGQNGFYNYNPHTGSFNEIKLFKKDPNPGFWTNAVGELYKDNNGFLWIATFTNGIFRYNMKTNEIVPLDQSEFPNTVRNANGF
ncbi:MAG: two-component regulator propeller domain-containing protein [Ignavibacteriaceae bacterium]